MSSTNYVLGDPLSVVTHGLLDEDIGISLLGEIVRVNASERRAVGIETLAKGEEVYAYMRQGLALEYGQRGDGSVYARVPTKTQKVRQLAYSRWQGTIIRNNTEEGVLTCQITATNSLMKPVNRETVSLVADVHYSAFKRLLVLSKINYEPRQENFTFPANFEDTKFKPYRTFTEVELPSAIAGK